MALKINDNGIDRNMTKAEEAAFLLSVEQIQAETEAQIEAQAAKAKAKANALAKLGLTADEAAALFG
jgi:hypothetical protein